MTQADAAVETEALPQEGVYAGKELDGLLESLGYEESDGKDIVRVITELNDVFGEDGIRFERARGVSTLFRQGLRVTYFENPRKRDLAALSKKINDLPQHRTNMIRRFKDPGKGRLYLDVQFFFGFSASHSVATLYPTSAVVYKGNNPAPELLEVIRAEYGSFRVK